ncbi:hypothetical protein BaRGS_00025176, partial [Batillaria attramentaria]
MAVKASKESQGFKLLQEDNLDDRPCPAVKKFVASVLDKKDIKDQDVAASFRNRRENREVDQTLISANLEGYPVRWENSWLRYRTAGRFPQREKRMSDGVQHVRYVAVDLQASDSPPSGRLPPRVVHPASPATRRHAKSHSLKTPPEQ